MSDGGRGIVLIQSWFKSFSKKDCNCFRGQGSLYAVPFIVNLLICSVGFAVSKRRSLLRKMREIFGAAVVKKERSDVPCNN